jgi:outer membrane lipopolysaccharide assembly protein LptE/RlpB
MGFRWLGAAALGLLVGCGYHFAGSGSLPADVSQVFIPVMENRSAETGLEQIFTNDLIDQFTRRRPESLAESRQSADGILMGTIVFLSVENIARSTVSTASERRVTANVNLRLTSPEGRILWSSGAIVERQTYSVSGQDDTAFDPNRNAAIANASRKIAESAFNRLTDDF